MKRQKRIRWVASVRVPPKMVSWMRYRGYRAREIFGFVSKTEAEKFRRWVSRHGHGSRVTISKFSNKPRRQK